MKKNYVCVLPRGLSEVRGSNNESSLDALIIASSPRSNLFHNIWEKKFTCILQYKYKMIKNQLLRIICEHSTFGISY